jgi:O-antigen/teichoic acid export membrane protein
VADVERLDASMNRQSRLSRNVVANLLGVGSNGLLTVIATPWYIALLGMEGYGLVGFWLVLQAVLSLCDLGLGATVLREFAAVGGQQQPAGRRRDLLRTLEYVYWPAAAALSALLFIAGAWLARHWLVIDSLPAESVTRSLQWMAIAIGAQFPNALYFSGLAGLQRQGTLNVLQVIGSVVRHGGGVAILYWRPDPAWFFAVQAIAAAGQTLATRVALWRLTADAHVAPRIQWSLLKDIWRFSAGMASTTIAGVLLANSDRLFLSKLMPTAELGVYALAWTAAGLLQLGIQPFYRAYFPRFVELYAAGDMARLRLEYYEGCRVVAAFVIPFAVIGWVFAPQIFGTWIGTSDETVVRVFRWLLVGVGAAGLMWLPAAFQQAQGWTKLHATMMFAALIVGVPSLWWTIGRWGTAGATAVWVIHGLSDATLGLWLMHRRLLEGEFAEWWRSVVLPPLLYAVPLVAVSWLLLPSNLGRAATGLWLAATVAVVLPGALIAIRPNWSLRMQPR